MSQFNLETFIDRQKIGSRHLAVLGILTMIMFIDGFDIFMLGAIAPAIAEGFGEPSSNMTIVFLFQQVGLAVGAFTFSPLADRFGRKRMLVISAIAFGVLTLACTFAQSLIQLAVLRGISGVFLSAVLPMTIALISESTPRRRRGMFISIVLAGYVSGSAASGAVAAWLIDDFGWQSGFWIGGLVPLLCVPLMLLLLPESIQYLASRDKRSPRVAKMVRQIEPGIELRGDEEFNLGNLDPNAKKATLLDVFKEGRFLTTSIFWVACFLSMGNIALLAAWLPTFLQEMGGMPIQEFGVLIMIALSTGLLGTLTAGYLGDKFKPTRLVAVYYVGLGLSMVAIGTIPFGTVAFRIVSGGSRFRGATASGQRQAGYHNGGPQYSLLHCCSLPERARWTAISTFAHKRNSYDV
jgi:MFS transporter, AAHS family, 4-hydroxybenzoate transporter